MLLLLINNANNIVLHTRGDVNTGKRHDAAVSPFKLLPPDSEDTPFRALEAFSSASVEVPLREVAFESNLQQICTQLDLC